ncbi:hypothetical protein FISHEDRAFT_54818 [Fistulina hepatica ATCC 64428]|uniref:Uncharacterized protein n=1 Tax=Fistulina hepatica ATCC 64428 TaxID=1128425 RepID=A0A0D7ARP7_9AGAR|nr:hypothetical protein FISHEDRAFT_54818 [Fistulina hepatica ATCC 64428]
MSLKNLAAFNFHRISSGRLQTKCSESLFELDLEISAANQAHIAPRSASFANLRIGTWAIAWQLLGNCRFATMSGKMAEFCQQHYSATENGTRLQAVTANQSEIAHLRVVAANHTGTRGKSFKTVVDQMRYRFEHKINQVHRSALRLTTIHNTTPMVPMVLCMWNIAWGEPGVSENDGCAGLAAFCFIGGVFVIDPDDYVNLASDLCIDWAGAFLVTAGLVLIIFVLGQGENAPQQWATPYIIALLIVVVFLMVLFIFWQRYLENSHNLSEPPRDCLILPPIMKVTLWKRSHWCYVGIMTIVLFNWSTFMGLQVNNIPYVPIMMCGMLMVPHFWTMLCYQDYMGFTPITTAVWLLLQFITSIFPDIFVMFIVAHLPVVLLLAGTLIMSIAALFTLSSWMLLTVTYWVFGFPSTVLSTIFVVKVLLPQEQSVWGGVS